MPSGPKSKRTTQISTDFRDGPAAAEAQELRIPDKPLAWPCELVTLVRCSGDLEHHMAALVGRRRGQGGGRVGRRTDEWIDECPLSDCSGFWIILGLFGPGPHKTKIILQDSSAHSSAPSSAHSSGRPSAHPSGVDSSVHSSVPGTWPGRNFFAGSQHPAVSWTRKITSRQSLFMLKLSFATSCPWAELLVVPCFVWSNL